MPFPFSFFYHPLFCLFLPPLHLTPFRLFIHLHPPLFSIFLLLPSILHFLQSSSFYLSASSFSILFFLQSSFLLPFILLLSQPPLSPSFFLPCSFYSRDCNSFMLHLSLYLRLCSVPFIFLCPLPNFPSVFIPPHLIPSFPFFFLQFSLFPIFVSFSSTLLFDPWSLVLFLVHYLL